MENVSSTMNQKPIKLSKIVRFEGDYILSYWTLLPMYTSQLILIFLVCYCVQEMGKGIVGIHFGSYQTWMQNASPSVLLASQCFCEAYHAQKKDPGIAAMTWDLVNSTSKAVQKMGQKYIILHITSNIMSRHQTEGW